MTQKKEKLNLLFGRKYNKRKIEIRLLYLIIYNSIAVQVNVA